MPYIVVLRHTNGTLSTDPYAVAIQARDLDRAMAKATEMAKEACRDSVVRCEVVAVFDALAGAIGPTVDKEFD